MLEKDVLSEEYVEEQNEEVIEPIYKSKYGNFTWQQDRMLAFGRTNAITYYFFCQLLGIILSIVALIILTTGQEMVDDGTVGIIVFSGIIGLIISLFIIGAINNFRQGSKTYNLRQAQSGVSRFLSIYKVLFTLQVIGTVIGGIGLFFLIVMSLGALGAAGAILFVIVLVAAVVIGISLYVMSQFIKFLEGIELNLSSRKNNFRYPSPETTILRAFVLIAIILSAMGVIAMFAMMASPTYNQYFTTSDLIITPINYIVGIVTSVVSYYALNQFDKVMMEYKKKVTY